MLIWVCGNTKLKKLKRGKFHGLETIKCSIYINWSKKFLFYHISQKLKAISKMNGLWILFLCVCSKILRSACVYQAQSLQKDICLIEKT